MQISCHHALLTPDTVGSHSDVAEIQETQAAEQFVQETLSNRQYTCRRAIKATLVKAPLVGLGDARHLSEGDAWSNIVDVLPHGVRDMIPSEVHQVS